MRLLAAASCLLLVGACSGPAPQAASRPASPSTTSPAPSPTPKPAPKPAPSPSPRPPDDWPTYGHDPARSAAAPGAPSLGTVGPAWAADLDQQVFAQPLYVDGHVLVATENNTLYSLVAATGALAWSAHFGDPVRGSTLPCGTIDPSGITSTPVVDVGAGTVYTVAYLQPNNHELYALALATGDVRWHLPIDPPGSTPRVQQQRGALTLAAGRVYVPFGGLNGDCGNYLGWVVGVAADGTGPLFTYRVPAQREGGIWASGGLALDSGGALLAAIGNASSTAGFDYGNAVVRLDRDLKVNSFWAPSDWAALNRADADIGSVTPLPLPADLVFQVGKSGTGYLLRDANLGGIGGEAFSAPVCGGGGAFGAAAVQAGLVYVPCRNGTTVALKLAGERFDIAWRGPGGWPPIVAYGSVWALTSTGSASLVQLDAATGAVLSSTPVGTTNHFCAPSAGGGRIYVPAGKRLLAFGRPA